jgi:N-acetylglucosamine kinase-like BadF-type ATPase
VSEWFLGLDGGQSSTTALIGDANGRIVGVGQGGPSNHLGAEDGHEKFVRTIGECVKDAAAAAGLDSGTLRFRSACLGFSGGPADKAVLLGEILPADRIAVSTDAHIALSGATAGEPGILVIAGTGSMALGRNAAGQTARAGGWGYAFGDEGGAFDIVRQALRAALRMEEGWGCPTTLHKILLEASGAADANDLLHRFYTADWPRPRIAALAPLVDQAAREGDDLASGILQQAAWEMAGLAAVVRTQLFKDTEPVQVSYAGGAFRSDLIREHFHELIEMTENNRFLPPQYGPAAGALLEAYRAVGAVPRLSDVPEQKK